MHPFTRYLVLASVLKTFQGRQRITLALVVAAIIEASAARSMEIATLQSAWLDIRFDSAPNRFHRALRNPRWLDITLTAQMPKLLAEKLTGESACGQAASRLRSSTRPRATARLPLRPMLRRFDWPEAACAHN